MPAVAVKVGKRGDKIVKQGSSSGSWATPLLGSLLFGSLMGLCAPGINQWYIAWFGLVPLLILTTGSGNVWQAFLRGTAFGTAYNLVYQNWYLGLQPLDWLGFNFWQGWLLAMAAWLIVSLHQGLIVGIFSAILRMVPLAGTMLPYKVQDKWHLPALIIIPITWVLITNKLGNAHSALGVPWSMLEYSQYKQTVLLQVCSIIGGIGLSCLIVLFNVALATLLATYTRYRQLKPLSAPNKTIAVLQLVSVTLILTVVMLFGFSELSSRRFHGTHTVSVVQSNTNIEMQKSSKRMRLSDILGQLERMLSRSGHAGGLTILSESAVPTYLRSEPAVIQFLATQARGRRQDMVVGAMDNDARGRAYNSAYGITSDGVLMPAVYHKRYLVPFGEYTPLLVQYFPKWIKRLTNTPAGRGFEAGRTARVLSLKSGAVAPLICFETISPELVSQSVRRGGELLVNISDLAWFHKSICGQQMIACSVLRAVENRRYFVFAANTGPSAVIDPQGKINRLSIEDREQVMLGRIGFMRQITPFSRLTIF